MTDHGTYNTKTREHTVHLAEGHAVTRKASGKHDYRFAVVVRVTQQKLDEARKLVEDGAHLLTDENLRRLEYLRNSMTHESTAHRRFQAACLYGAHPARMPALARQLLELYSRPMVRVQRWSRTLSAAEAAASGWESYWQTVNIVELAEVSE